MKLDGYNEVIEIKTVRDEYGRTKPASFSDPIHRQSVKQCLSYIDFAPIKKLSAFHFGKKSLSERYKRHVNVYGRSNIPGQRMLSHYDIDLRLDYYADEFDPLSYY